MQTDVSSAHPSAERSAQEVLCSFLQERARLLAILQRCGLRVARCVHSDLWDVRSVTRTQVEAQTLSLNLGPSGPETRRIWTIRAVMLTVCFAAPSVWAPHCTSRDLQQRLDVRVVAAGRDAGLRLRLCGGGATTMGANRSPCLSANYKNAMGYRGFQKMPIDF